jgi:tetratricopeptide (TPR) repeat protein
VDQSLLVCHDDPDGEPRFTMLETIREYAMEQLEAGGEAPEIQRRHAAWCTALAESVAVGPGVPDARRHEQMELVDLEIDNLRAAMAWSLGNGGDGGSTALRIALSVGGAWDLRGRYSEGRRWLEAALARDQGRDPARREQALVVAGALALRQGDQARAQTCFEEALTLARTRADRVSETAILVRLGNLSAHQGAFDRSRELYRRALAVPEAQELDMINTSTLASVGWMERQAGDLAASREALEAGLRRLRNSSPRPSPSNLAVTLVNLAQTALLLGDEDAARSALRELLELCRREGITPFRIGGIRTAALLARTVGDHAQAARLAGATDALLAAYGRGIDGATDQALFRQAKEAARASLGEAAYAAAYAAGSRLNLDEAAALAEETAATPPPAARTTPGPRGLMEPPPSR